MTSGSIEQSIFLGLDGGGTKTDCLIARGTGQVVGYGRGGPVNLNFVSAETARASITEAVCGAWQAAGQPSVAPAVAGVSGPISLAMAEEIIRRETGAKQVIGVGEWEAAWWAVSPWLDYHYGIAVDAGTGSLAAGFNRYGQKAGAGGLGTVLGDEGSGYWIGIQAMRAALRAEDGREPPTRLQQAIREALGLKHLRELIPLFYQRGLARHEVAALAPVVVEVARQGDEKAREILAEAGRELALAVNAVVRKLGMENEKFPVIAFGSVFKAGELIMGPFREAVLEVAPNAEVVVAHHAPVVGALVRAMVHGGVQLTEQLLTQLEEGLRREAPSLVWDH